MLRVWHFEVISAWRHEWFLRGFIWYGKHILLKMYPKPSHKTQTEHCPCRFECTFKFLEVFNSQISWKQEHLKMFLPYISHHYHHLRLLVYNYLVVWVISETLCTKCWTSHPQILLFYIEEMDRKVVLLRNIISILQVGNVVWGRSVTLIVS